MELILSQHQAGIVKIEKQNPIVLLNLLYVEGKKNQDKQI